MKIVVFLVPLEKNLSIECAEKLFETNKIIFSRNINLQSFKDDEKWQLWQGGVAQEFYLLISKRVIRAKKIRNCVENYETKLSSAWVKLKSHRAHLKKT